MYVREGCTEEEYRLPLNDDCVNYNHHIVEFEAFMKPQWLQKVRDTYRVFELVP